jgi:hypothetical protein
MFHVKQDSRTERCAATLGRARRAFRPQVCRSAFLPTRITRWRARGRGLRGSHTKPWADRVIAAACGSLSHRHTRPLGAKHLDALRVSAARLPTARAVTKSNDAPEAARENSSKRSPRTSTPSNSQALATSLRNALFFATGSSSVTASSGATILSASPGKPAPLPISSSLPPRATQLARNKLSPKCRVTHSSALRTAVRFILSFQRSKRSR